jgi:heterodisulfide reductase subunit A-like polyferredoxin
VFVCIKVHIITIHIISVLIVNVLTFKEPSINASESSLPVLVASGGIGGIARALALVRQGLAVKVLEQAP